MRGSAPALLPLLLGLLLAVPARAAAPVIGCPSLANLRLLLKQADGDAAVAAAVLANEKADHLGCSVLARETVTAQADHVALNGRAYDCMTLRTTSVCHWTVAGAITPAGTPPAARRSPVERAPATRPEPRR